MKRREAMGSGVHYHYAAGSVCINFRIGVCLFVMGVVTPNILIFTSPTKSMKNRVYQYLKSRSIAEIQQDTKKRKDSGGVGR
jgi:hypothetical protein